jgi:hypothetical protein
MKPVVALLFGQHEHDQQAHRHGNGQPEHVDKSKCLVAAHRAQGYFEVVFEHGWTVVWLGDCLSGDWGKS